MLQYFWEQEINARSQVLTAVLLCRWVRRCRRFDRPCYLHPQRQAVVRDCCCQLSCRSRDFENSGTVCPKTAPRRHIVIFDKSVNLSNHDTLVVWFQIKYVSQFVVYSAVGCIILWPMNIFNVCCNVRYICCWEPNIPISTVSIKPLIKQAMCSVCYWA